jgi:hypothetical protein
MDKVDKRKLATRIMAGILAFLMLAGILFTLIFYIVAY